MRMRFAFFNFETDYHILKPIELRKSNFFLPIDSSLHLVRKWLKIEARPNIPIDLDLQQCRLF